MVKKIRFFYFLLLALSKKQWKKIFSLLLFFCVLLILFFTSADYVKSFFSNAANNLFKQTYIEAIVGEPKTFNPLISKTENENEINKLVFRGLTKINSDGAIVGDLAEKIEIKDETEYVFSLKKDIFWHDGKEFGADDVVYTIELAQKSFPNSTVALNFKDVIVKKLDKYHVSFKLKEPFSPFLSATTVGIIPKHISLNNYRPIGTGKFRFIDLQKDFALLESENIRLKFKFYPSSEIAETALKLGEVHAITSYDPTKDSLSRWDKFNIYESYLGLRSLTLFFNTRSEILKEKQVRQALAYSLNKEDLIKSKTGKKGVIAVNSFASVNSLKIKSNERYLFNLEKAKQLLKNSGWQLKDNLLYKNGKKLSLTITTIADNETLETAKAIQKSWQKLGIDVEIDIISATELKNQVVPNKIFTVLLSTQFLDPDPDQYVIWHTTQTNNANISGISSPKLDKLLEDGRKTLDQALRKEKYQEFTRLLSDEVPAIFLYHPRYVWVVSKRIKNINLKNFLEPSDRFLSSDKWRIENPIF